MGNCNAELGRCYVGGNRFLVHVVCILETCRLSRLKRRAARSLSFRSGNCPLARHQGAYVAASLYVIALFLGGVPEPWYAVCKFALQQLLLFSQFLCVPLLRNFLPPCVLETAPSRHEKGKAESHTTGVSQACEDIRRYSRDDGDQKAVTLNIARPIATDVDVRCDDASTVATHHLEMRQH